MGNKHREHSLLLPKFTRPYPCSLLQELFQKGSHPISPQLRAPLSPFEPAVPPLPPQSMASVPAAPWVLEGVWSQFGFLLDIQLGKGFSPRPGTLFSKLSQSFFDILALPANFAGVENTWFAPRCHEVEGFRGLSGFHEQHGHGHVHLLYLRGDKADEYCGNDMSL